MESDGEATAVDDGAGGVARGGRWGRVSPARGAREERVGEKPGVQKVVLAGARHVAGGQGRAPFPTFAGLRTPGRRESDRVEGSFVIKTKFQNFIL